MEGAVCIGARRTPPSPPFQRGIGGAGRLRCGVEEVRGQPVYFGGHAVFGLGRAGAGEILALFGGNAVGHVGCGLPCIGQSSGGRIAALETRNGQIEDILVEMVCALLASGLIVLHAGAERFAIENRAQVMRFFSRLGVKYLKPYTVVIPAKAGIQVDTCYRRYVSRKNCLRDRLISNSFFFYWRTSTLRRVSMT